jgi:hypothetical protein
VPIDLLRGRQTARTANRLRMPRNR